LTESKEAPVREALFALKLVCSRVIRLGERRPNPECSGGGLLLQRLLIAGFLDEGFAREANFVAFDGKPL